MFPTKKYLMRYNKRSFKNTLMSEFKSLKKVFNLIYRQLEMVPVKGLNNSIPIQFNLESLSSNNLSASLFDISLYPARITSFSRSNKTSYQKVLSFSTKLPNSQSVNENGHIFCVLQIHTARRKPNIMFNIKSICSKSGRFVQYFEHFVQFWKHFVQN